MYSDQTGENIAVMYIAFQFVICLYRTEWDGVWYWQQRYSGWRSITRADWGEYCWNERPGSKRTGTPLAISAIMPLAIDGLPLAISDISKINSQLTDCRRLLTPWLNTAALSKFGQSSHKKSTSRRKNESECKFQFFNIDLSTYPWHFQVYTCN